MIYLILAAGLILRLVSLNQSLWLDEATSALAAKMSLGDLFTKFLPGDFHPPLYYLILKYWTNIFGNSEIALRIPSVIFGIITIYAIYLIGKEISGSRLGLIASALLATSGLHIYYSQEARMYSLAAALVTLSIYLFIKKKWTTFGICIALTGLTDYLSLLIVPVFLILGRKDIKKIAVSLIPFTVSFMFWLPLFVRQLSAGFSVSGSAWWNILGTVTFKNIALIPAKFLIGRISFDDKKLYGIIVGLMLVLIGYLLYRARKSSKILWYWLAAPIAFGIILSFKIPALTYFRFLFVLPSFYLLIASGIEKTGKYQNIFLVPVLLMNILTAGYYLTNYKFQREDWRAAAKTIGGDKIIFPENSHAEALIYYGKESQITDLGNLNKADKEVWLSRYVVEITDPTDSTRSGLESLGYNKAREFDFNGVVFWEYLKR